MDDKKGCSVDSNVKELQERFAQAIASIEDAILEKTTQIDEQKTLHKSIEKSLDNNMSVLARIIDRYEEQQ